MLQMRGDSGVLKVGYQLAVRLSNWSLTCSRECVDKTDWDLRATVAWADRFWSTQPPTEIRLLIEQGLWWRWVELVVTSGTVIQGKQIAVVFRGEPEPRQFEQQ